MKQFEGKQYKEVLPCGLLTTRAGKIYFLLSPYPIVKDSWQHDKQQRFVVVPHIELSFHGDDLYYSYARHLVTTDPDIEYFYARTPILIQYLSGHDVAEMSWEVNENEENVSLTEDDPNYTDYLIEFADQYQGEGLG